MKWLIRFYDWLVRKRRDALETLRNIRIEREEEFKRYYGMDRCECGSSNVKYYYNDTYDIKTWECQWCDHVFDPAEDCDGWEPEELHFS